MRRSVHPPTLHKVDQNRRCRDKRDIGDINYQLQFSCVILRDSAETRRFSKLATHVSFTMGIAGVTPAATAATAARAAAASAAAELAPGSAASEPLEMRRESIVRAEVESERRATGKCV